MKTVAFDARDPAYKRPFGAVKSGTGVSLRIKLHKSAKAAAVYLYLRRDENTVAYQRLAMAWQQSTGEYTWYTCTFTPTEGLYFYHFSYDSPDGGHRITRGSHSEGVLDGQSDWQLTVFDADFSPPTALAGGIIYQIFPDRFCASGTPKVGVPEDRCLRADWGGQPAWRQTEEKCSLGNDYFGGDLAGITRKLPYLQSLGVNILYLNLIFEAHSNHRYNTADYFKIDPLLGTEEDFKTLCATAKQLGIQVILDGVFSHIGDDSRYYNRYGRYATVGAFQSQASPYFNWFHFTQWPTAKSWWGVPSLPETNEDDPEFTDFIAGPQGVLRHWLRLGASGFRLDVADELPDAFLDRVRAAVKAENPDALLLGEVWEDATNKIRYGKRRRFLRGRQLDSVMNYPFADAIEAFLLGENARVLMDLILEICENYPTDCLHLLMNHIGTHDTPRILTVLGAGKDLGTREEQANLQLEPQQLAKAKTFLRLAAALQYTLPGLPSLYYGDEAGLQGGGDPFCRGCYPWGQEDQALLNFYKKLGQARRNCPAFACGEFIPLEAAFGHIAYIRQTQDSAALLAVNRWCDPQTLTVPEGWDTAKAVFGTPPKGNTLTVPSEDFVLLIKN